MIGSDLEPGPRVAANRHGGSAHVAEPAHAQLGEGEPGVESSRNVDASIDDAGAACERVYRQAQFGGARRAEIGQCPGTLVHAQIRRHMTSRSRSREATAAAGVAQAMPAASPCSISRMTRPVSAAAHL